MKAITVGEPARVSPFIRMIVPWPSSIAPVMTGNAKRFCPGSTTTGGFSGNSANPSGTKSLIVLIVRLPVAS